MSKTKFTHALPDGQIATRTSVRTYTHVVIGRRRLEVDRAAARRDAMQYRDDFKYYQKVVTAGVGGRYPGMAPWRRGLTAGEVADAKQAIDGYTDADTYAEARVASRLECIGPGEFGPWEALRWSGSLANAAKGARDLESCGYAVQIEPINGGAR